MIKVFIGGLIVVSMSSCKSRDMNSDVDSTMVQSATYKFECKNIRTNKTKEMFLNDKKIKVDDGEGEISSSDRNAIFMPEDQMKFEIESQNLPKNSIYYSVEGRVQNSSDYVLTKQMLDGKPGKMSYYQWDNRDGKLKLAETWNCK